MVTRGMLALAALTVENRNTRDRGRP
jgi:hypothetical protein